MWYSTWLLGRQDHSYVRGGDILFPRTDKTSSPGYYYKPGKQLVRTCDPSWHILVILLRPHIYIYIYIPHIQYVVTSTVHIYLAIVLCPSVCYSTFESQKCKTAMSGCYIYVCRDSCPVQFPFLCASFGWSCLQVGRRTVFLTQQHIGSVVLLVQHLLVANPRRRSPETGSDGWLYLWLCGSV